MFSNSVRVITLSLLASAANVAFAAPAPVADINSTSSSTTSSSSNANSGSQLDRLERLIESRNQVQLQLQQQLDGLANDLRDLRGQIEKNSYDIQQVIQRQRDLFVELDNVRTNIKTAASAPATETQSASSEQGTYSENVDEQTAYQNAVDLILKKKDYAGAIDAFIQFNKSFPESVFSPNSYYWLGQLYYAKKQDSDASTSFEKVIAYPSSNKRPDALLKLGEIASRQNQQTAANQYYQQVINEYPNSASADVARKQVK